MIKKTTLLLSLALTTTIICCQKKESPEIVSVAEIKTFKLLEKANWLVGEWENTTKEGMLTEKWTKENDSTFTALSCIVNENDTIQSEKIVMKQEGNDLYYVPTIKVQNDGMSVQFKMTEATESQLVFENKMHDFPQKIIYIKVSNNNLIAEISGIKDGVETKESYPMKRK
ncbi:MAG: DUF6265 family protein [Bacteroidota bacterium]